MIIFHSDLDNTLIYSYKRDIGENKKCVEIYQDREISFMTDESYELLQEVNKHVLIVPTTTRTREQYERIDLGIGTPKYALVCNGGILLVDGKIDEEWYKESLRLVSDCANQFVLARSILEKDSHVCFEIRLLNDLFLFTKSNAPDETLNLLKDRLDLDKVDVFKNGIKIYVVPKVLDKGSAVKRFLDKYSHSTSIAAGDSLFDLPMLAAADHAIAPESLAAEGKIAGKVSLYKDGPEFTKNLLSHVLEVAGKDIKK